MHLHDIWPGIWKRRLDRLAAKLAEGRVPWILSQASPRMRGVAPECWRGYVRAWAGVAIQGCATANQLPGLNTIQRAGVMALAVEKAADEVLHKAATRKHRHLRKAA